MAREYNVGRLSQMKKFISKLFITLVLICIIQSKLPSRNFEIPFIQYIESIAPYNDIPNYPEYKG